MNYPQNFEQKIGFDKIRQILLANCLSTLGKDKVHEMSFLTDFDSIQTLLLQTNEFKQIVMFEDDFPTNYFYDARRQLEHLKIEGTILDLVELIEIKRSLETIRSILVFFKARERQEKYPELIKLLGNVVLYPFVIERIDSVVGKTGGIKDNASPELARIRGQLMSKQTLASNRLNKILQTAKDEGWIEKDANLSVRDGKMLIPVPTAYKRRIKGFVTDESATGKTSFIEPVEIIELNNEIRELEFAERREILKILAKLSDEIRPYSDDLLLAYNFLAEIDFIRAKALFANNILARMPIIENKVQLEYIKAVHPLLFLSLQKEKRKVVPLDIEIKPEARIVLISGPNAGGKSVCLKTVGLLQYMLQSGLLVSCSDTSHFGIFSKIFIDIGDEQSIENDLSTYSSHLYNMKHFLQNGDPSTLVLIDEFGTGTEPLLGGAVAQAILQKLNEMQINGVITTHYSNLKHFASSAEGIINAAMLFDTDNMKPLFQLELHKPGSSFTIEIAKQIGLPNEILHIASDIVGQDHIDFDKHLKELENDRRVIVQLRAQLQQKEEKLNATLDKYNKALSDTITERNEIIAKANETAQNIISTANKKIENTILEIRKNQADKEKTREIRNEFETYKKDQENKTQMHEDAVKNKMEKIKQRQERRKNKEIPENIILDKEKIKDKPIDSNFRVGDKVRLKGQPHIGEILEIKHNLYEIAFGSLKTTLNKERIEKLSEKELFNFAKDEVRKAGVIHMEKDLNAFSFQLDVRGMRGQEALDEVRDYIDRAIVASASQVRILHGKGNGILRQLIRQYLDKIKEVKSIEDERVDIGGVGISVVSLHD